MALLLLWRDTLPYCEHNPSASQTFGLLRENPTRTIEHKRYDIQTKFASYVEGTLMESPYSTVTAACALRIDCDAIPLSDKFLEFGQDIVYALRDGVIFGMSYDIAEKGAAPYPVVGQ